MSELSQYVRILETIRSFEAGELKFGDLVNRLEELINGLQGISQEKTNRFLAEWGVLEDVYAFALDQEWERVEGEDVDLIERSLQRLSALAETEMGLAGGSLSTVDPRD